MSQLFSEATQFIDEATGELLVGGFLYIGTNGLDAKLNAVSIYPDRELSGTPLANPQRIGSDGRALNKIWIAGKYSFKVESSANVQKYNELENGFDEAVGNTLLINSLGVNDVVVNGSPTVTTLVDSQTYVFTAPADNTGAMTLKIDNTAVMPLKIRHDQALASGDIKADQKIVIVANLTDGIFEVINDLSGVTLNGVEELTNKTLTTPTITSPTITNPAISGATGTAAYTSQLLTVGLVPVYGMFVLDIPEKLVDDLSPPVAATAIDSATLNAAGAIKAILRIVCINDSPTEVFAASATYTNGNAYLKLRTESDGDNTTEFVVNLDGNNDFWYSCSDITITTTFEIYLIGYYV